MREIKIRQAWKNNNNGIISYSYWTLDNLKRGINGLDSHLLIGEDLYSGLTDKNKKEIYESDIVKDLDGKLCIIEFQLGCFVLKTDKWPHIFHGYNTRLCEIVGNIYENSDLPNPKGLTV